MSYVIEACDFPEIFPAIPDSILENSWKDERDIKKRRPDGRRMERHGNNNETSNVYVHINVTGSL